MTTIITHAGAANIPDELWQAHQNACKQAYDAGIKILDENGTAVDAVTAALQVMENIAILDAGIGGYLTTTGKIELDAGLMEGKTFRSGAVINVSCIKSPIAAARAVLLNSEHCLFAGEGAHEFAKAFNLEMVNDDYHIIEEQRELLKKLHTDDGSILNTIWKHRDHDTVGAIALDHEGNLAAGNSTGGIPYKQPGRVGDAALVGNGFYADNHIGAFVCTGKGEAIMESQMGMFALFALKSGKSAQEAAKIAIDRLQEATPHGRAGILVMTPDGKFAMEHNTTHMAHYLHFTH